MTRLEVWLDQDRVGRLLHDGATNRFSFEYTRPWREGPRSYAITPRIPLVPITGQTPESHSVEVRQFFENLLPEGEALDHAAQANGISRSNLVGLMVALGKETAGALRVVAARDDADDSDLPANPPATAEDDREPWRRVTPEELSERIRQRAQMPFSVWDGKVRLSMAGYQDKIALYQRGDTWYLVDGPRLASTVIVKPLPARPQWAALPYNEFLCMQLAQRAGLAVARTQLVHVPEPVLFVRRFDRVEQPDRVRRLHLVDACQALGLSAAMKYERPYGDAPEVRNIRDGATCAKLFSLLAHSPQPALDRLALLRWVIFQVLIGNTDAHGKNLSFFCGVDGLRLAPAYDMVCMPALASGRLSETFAMAIGDAFTQAEITPLEWAAFAQACGLPLALVSRELERLPAKVMAQLPAAEDEALRAGVPQAVIDSVRGVVEPNCTRHAGMSGAVRRVPAD